MLLAGLFATAFTVLGPDGQATLRILEPGARCPSVRVDGKLRPTHERVGPATLPARGRKGDSTAFPSRVCELVLPRAAHRASVQGQPVPLAPPRIDRFVAFGDSGCRMKRSDGRFQACNDESLWSFAAVARTAAALKPQLVVQLGDMHYRESACPDDQPGCQGSPAGYGEDTWRADLFTPATPLLRAAPWVFVRGNHESCARAGLGWFRFLDPAPWSAGRSCETPENDAGADFADPYAVPLGGSTQLIVFDSSRNSSKPYAADDPAMQRYQDALRRTETLGKRAQHNLFVSHHPLLGIAPPKKEDGQAEIGPSLRGLYSAAKALYPQTVLPPNMQLGLHGHVHLFEAIEFAGGQAPVLIAGTGGSEHEGLLPEQLPSTALPYPDLEVAAFHTNGQRGFSLFERDGADWKISAYDPAGKVLARCRLHGKKLRCTAA